MKTNKKTKDNLYFLGGATKFKAPEDPNKMSVEQGANLATGVVGAVGSMLPSDSKGGAALSGAAAGAQLGSIGGPLGMGAGALLGGAASFIGAGKQQKEAEHQEYVDDIQNRNQMLGINTMANGGMLTEFNNGGSHETNPLQGIPQGIAEDGSQNKVEQGETKWEDYIFSDRLKINNRMANYHNLPSKFIGKSFADVSKKVSEQHKERPNDPISRDTTKAYMATLMAANDDARAVKESRESAKLAKEFADGGKLYENGELLDLNSLNTRTGFKPKPLITDIDNNNLRMWENTRPESFMSTDKMGANPNMDMSVQPYDEQPVGLADMNRLSDDSITALNKKSDKLNNRFWAKENLKNTIADDNGKALRYAPIAFNALAGSGLFGNAPKPKEFNPTMIQNQGRLKAQQFDTEPVRAAVDQSFQTGINSLAGATGGSGAAMRANLMGLQSQYSKGLGQAYLSAQERNLQNKQGVDQYNLSSDRQTAGINAQLLNQAGMYNTQVSNQYDSQKYNNRMDYLGAAAEGLGDVGYEQRNREILPKIFGYDDMARFIKPEYLKSRGGKLRKK